MPLLPQLFIHSRLMVDLIVESQKDFEQRLGVSVEQFIKLARAGLVLPNLAYDSEFLDAEGNLVSQGGAYSDLEYINRILSDECVVTTINRLRRDALFRSMGYRDSDRVARRLDARHRLKLLIEKESVEELNSVHFGMSTNSVNSSLEKLSYGLLYIDLFADYFGLSDISEKIFNFSRKLDENSPLSFVEQVSATKSDIAGQITANFGGIQSISATEYRRMQLSRWSTLANPERSVVEDQRQAFGKHMIALSNSRYERLRELRPIEIKLPIQNERDFDNLLAFMLDFLGHKDEMDSLYEASKALIGDAEKALAYENYMNKAIEISQQAEWHASLADVLVVGATGGGAAVAGTKLARGGVAEGRMPSLDRRGLMSTFFWYTLAFSAGQLAVNASEPYLVEAVGTLTDKVRADEINTARSIVLDGTNFFTH